MAMKQHEIVVEAHAVGQRLDRFLAERCELSRSAVERMVEQGDVTVEGKTVAKNYRLRGGERILLSEQEPEPTEAVAQDIPLDIVFEDRDVVVVNKPQGMVVHPAAGNPDGTLVNALLYHCKGSLSGIGGVIRPGIVHRIDKDTSGLLVVAKNDRAHLALAEQLKTHTVSRVYQAIALGNFKQDLGTVDKPIDRHPVDRKRMAIARKGAGREAVTHFEVIERYGAFTYVKCRLETGRTHQIRVHLASLGHPLLGDPVYGGDGTKFGARHRALLHGQCLHAGELSFIHPTTGEEMRFFADLPEDFSNLLELLRRECQ